MTKSTLECKSEPVPLSGLPISGYLTERANATWKSRLYILNLLTPSRKLEWDVTDARYGPFSHPSFTLFLETEGVLTGMPPRSTWSSSHSKTCCPGTPPTKWKVCHSLLRVLCSTTTGACASRSFHGANKTGRRVRCLWRRQDGVDQCATFLVFSRS